MKLPRWMFLGYNFPGLRDAIARLAQHQENVIRIMTVLPGKYRYEQVEAAMNASKVSPYDLYMAIATDLRVANLERYGLVWDVDAHRQAIALEQFYEALGEP